MGIGVESRCLAVDGRCLAGQGSSHDRGRGLPFQLFMITRAAGPRARNSNYSIPAVVCAAA